MKDRDLKKMVQAVMDTVHSATNVQPEDVVLALLSAAATYAVVHAGINDGEGFGDTAQDLFDAANETFADRNEGRGARVVH